MTLLKKKAISTILVFCILIASVFMFDYNVSACGIYVTWQNDAKLIGGVGSYGDHVRYYWVDSSASAEIDLISQARYNWVNTTAMRTSILIRQISTQSSSVFDISKSQQYPHGLGRLGVSHFYNTSNEYMGTPTYDYKWTQIVLITRNFNELPTNGMKLGTISHEFGHCFGLAHSSRDTSLMYSENSASRPNTPTNMDLAAINHLYG